MSVFLHRLLLADRIRCNLYRKAIRETVEKGNIVVDIGSGTGLLSFFAVQSGARKVYALEKGDIIEDAKRATQANNWDRKIIFIKGLSTEINLSEKADVIISETLGNFGVEEGIVRYIIDAKKRFLKKGGRLIPSYLELFLAPIEASAIYGDKIDFWSKDLYGIDFRILRKKMINYRHIQQLNPRGLLARPVSLYKIDFYNTNDEGTKRIHNILIYDIKRDGVVHGFAGWFNARLSDRVFLSNSPMAESTHWMNNFFPIEKPTPVKKGDTILVKVTGNLLSKKIIWTWGVRIFKKLNRTKIKEYVQSTFWSTPI